MDSTELGAVLTDRRVNAGLGWLLVATLVLVVVESLPGDALWAGFAAGVALLAVVPPVAYRRGSVMLPWEVVALAALPIAGRAFATVPVTSTFAAYLAVAAVALIVSVELHVFTPVRMTPGFAVLFVVVATLAAAGVWAVVRWLSDLYLGTAFFHPPGVPESEVERALMLEFVYSTLAGVVAGVVFERYFRRRARADERLPEDVALAARALPDTDGEGGR